MSIANLPGFPDFDGNTGPTGATGSNTGFTGATGPTGSNGGITGATGPTGIGNISTTNATVSYSGAVVASNVGKLIANKINNIVYLTVQQTGGNTGFACTSFGTTIVVSPVLPAGFRPLRDIYTNTVLVFTKAQNFSITPSTAFPAYTNSPHPNFGIAIIRTTGQIEFGQIDTTGFGFTTTDLIGIDTLTASFSTV